MNKRAILSLILAAPFICFPLMVAQADCFDNDEDRYYVEDPAGDCDGRLGLKGIEEAICDGDEDDGYIDCLGDGEIVCNADLVEGGSWDVAPGADDTKIDGRKIHPGAVDAPQNGIDEDCDGKDGEYVMGGSDDRDLNDLIQSAIGILSGIVGSVSAAVFIWGGITFATSAGNDDKIRKAKKTMIGAGIGLVVAISAWTIVRYIVERFI